MFLLLLFLFPLLLPIGVIVVGIITIAGLLTYPGVPRPPRNLLSPSAASSFPFSLHAPRSDGTSFSFDSPFINGTPFSLCAPFGLCPPFSPLRMSS